MPYLEANGARLYYEEKGSGDPVVFSHGLLMSGRMWDAQVAALSAGHRCIAYDHRGQGQSQVTETGYDMDGAARDAAALIEGLGAAPCHFVGLSMGGFVGLRLAIRRPESLRSLVLLETSADPEPPENVGRYRMMALVARLIGTRLLVRRVMPILFGRTFLEDPAREEERLRWRRHLANVDRHGAVRATRGVIERAAVMDELPRITTPTLVMVGDEDVATVPAKAERIVANIPGARLVTVPRAGHSSCLEQPAAVNGVLLGWFQGR